MSDLGDHVKRSQQYMKLGDKETFKGFYISWEAIKTKFGKNGYRFTLEREDGSRLFWETGNIQAVQQISDCIDAGMKKGDPITIQRFGLEKDDTKYKITSEVPF